VLIYSFIKGASHIH